MRRAATGARGRSPATAAAPAGEASPSRRAAAERVNALEEQRDISPATSRIVLTRQGTSGRSSVPVSMTFRSKVDYINGFHIPKLQTNVN